MNLRKFDRPSNTNIQGHGIEDTRNQVARLLIVSGMAFFLCYLPFFTFRVNDALLTLSDGTIGLTFDPKLYGVLVWVVRGMSTANSVINPIVYNVTSKRYRQAFISVFTCRITSNQNSMMTLELSHRGVLAR